MTKVKRLSDEITYSRIGANVDLKFQVQTDDAAYLGVEIIFQYSKINEIAFSPIFKINFNDQGEPVYKTDLDDAYKGRVSPVFQDARLTVTIQTLKSTVFNKTIHAK